MHFNKEPSGIRVTGDKKLNKRTACRSYVTMQLPPNFPKVISEEKIKSRDENCLMDVHCFPNACRLIEDSRCYLPMNYRKELYFPAYRPQIHMNNKLCKYSWSLCCLPVITDLSLFKHLTNAIKNALNILKTNGALKSEVIILNNHLCHLQSLDQIKKHRFIRNIAKLLSHKNNIKWISAEKEFLSDSDGLKLLLVFSIGTGTTLEYLHLWNFMRDPGYNSYKYYKDYRLHLMKNVEIPDIYLTEEVKAIVWDRIVTPRSINELPKHLHYFAYYVFLRTLENLNTLSIKYSMLAGGLGESLSLLECVRNGRLRLLNLLCTTEDLPSKTKQAISNSSWAKALATCSLLRVNFVSIQVIHFDDLKQFFLRKMPLEGFHVSSTAMPISDRAGSDGWLLGKSLRLMLNYYGITLKKLCFDLLCSPQCLNSALTLLISGCPYLEEFEYRGMLSSIITIRDICDFYSHHETRLKKLQILIREDPCSPDTYTVPLQEIQNEYEAYFINKGIDFRVGTYKI